MDIQPPEIPQEEISQQWDCICKCLTQEIIDDNKLVDKKRNALLHFKVFDANRKRLEEKGFWTTNHVVSCPIRHRHTYVTVVSWA